MPPVKTFAECKECHLSVGNHFKNKQIRMCRVCFAWHKLLKLAETNPSCRERVKRIEKYRARAENKLPLFVDLPQNSQRIRTRTYSYS